MDENTRQNTPKQGGRIARQARAAAATIAFAVGVNAVAHEYDESFGGGIYPYAGTCEAGVTKAANWEDLASLAGKAAVDVPSQSA